MILGISMVLYTTESYYDTVLMHCGNNIVAAIVYGTKVVLHNTFDQVQLHLIIPIYCHPTWYLGYTMHSVKITGSNTCITDEIQCTHVSTCLVL